PLPRAAHRVEGAEFCRARRRSAQVRGGQAAAPGAARRSQSAGRRMSALTLTLAEGVAAIALDDGKVNALSEQMLEALLAAIDQARAADAALLVYSRAGVLYARFDRSLLAVGVTGCDAMRAAGDRLTLALLDYPAPVVIASTGHAMAKAAFMLLLADYRIGAAGAFNIALNEVAIGMTMPDAAMPQARRLAPQWLNR